MNIILIKRQQKTQTNNKVILYSLRCQNTNSNHEFSSYKIFDKLL